MGTWGTGIFENDSAADWANFFGMNPSLGFIEETLDQCIDEATDYLDSDIGAQGLAAAETLARARTKTGNESDFSEPADRWAATFIGTIPPELLQKAAAVVDLVLSERSELNELWLETMELYPLWRLEADRLKERLLA